MFRKGDRVICSNHFDINKKYIGVWYPPIGTSGIVIRGNEHEEEDLLIRWDEGTEDSDFFITVENVAHAPHIFHQDVDDLICSMNEDSNV